jgi:hypothetical protein
MMIRRHKNKRAEVKPSAPKTLPKPDEKRPEEKKPGRKKGR